MGTNQIRLQNTDAIKINRTWLSCSTYYVCRNVDKFG